MDRRQFFERGTAAGVLAALGLHRKAGAAQNARASSPVSLRSSSPPDLEALAARYRDNIYTRMLGVRPHLPAHEHISRLSGSRMPPEVTRAMAEANEFFVDMNDLLQAANARIAGLLGAEAALITAGGFSAMVLGAAACLTGTDAAKADALPHPTWPRRECLIPTIHRFDYDRAYRAAGMTIVEIETRDQLLGALGERTAMIAAISAVEHQIEFGPPRPKSQAHPPPPGALLPTDLIAIGRQAGVPVLIDPASDIPPHENLTKYFGLGADLVVFSGGKAFRGPQSTGILAGRRDLIDAAALNAFPNANLGRGMKVGKEEVIGLLVAMDRYLELDHHAQLADWARKAEYIAGELKGIAGLTAEAVPNTADYVDVHLTWDERVIPFGVDEVKSRLRQGTPPVIYDGDTVRTRCLEDGEERLVAARLRELFTRELVGRG